MERLFDYKPDFNRLKKVLLRDGEPDIVPFCEFWVDPEVISSVTRKPVSLESIIEFFYTLGYDFIPVGANFGYPRRIISVEDTAELSKGGTYFCR